MKSVLQSALLALSTALTVHTAQGVVLFSDNFNDETVGLNATPSGWTLASGAVDLIGNDGVTSAFDLLPGNGVYIDMDGSIGDGAEIRHFFPFLAAGDYVLSYDYAGNNRADQSGEELIGAVNSEFFNIPAFHYPAWNAGFTTATIAFTMPADTATFNIRFETNSNDNIGPLLDNVKLERVDSPSGVPEGGTGVAMLGLALAALAGARRLGRRQA